MPFPVGGTGGRGGGGLHFAVPPRIFAGANLAACRTARNTHFAGAGNAAELETYQADQYLAIILRPQGAAQVVETYLPGQAGQAYDATQWVDRGSSAVTDAHIDSRIATYARAAPTGVMALAQAPAGLLRTAALAGAVGAEFGGFDGFAYDAGTGVISVAYGTIGRRQLAAESVASGHLVANAVIGTKVASGEIDTRHLAAAAVERANLAANAVGEPELLDSAVTLQKLAADVRAMLGGGGDVVSGPVGDHTITPVKLLADTAARDREWRELFESSQITAGVTLPDLAAVNVGDVRVITTDVASGLSFVDVAEQSTEVTNALAGDVIMVFMLRAKAWVRVGNILRGSPAVRTAIERAQAAADTAQLDSDTVLEVGPAFIHNEAGPKVLGVSIRHPLNAYSTATVMTVSPAGQPAVIVEYDRAHIQQDTLAEVSAVSLQNIWNQEDAIDDGQGGTTRVKRYPVGSYIPVEIRLREGRNGDTVFFRIVELQVIDSAVVDQTARTAAANAAARTPQWRRIGAAAGVLAIRQTDSEFMVEIAEANNSGVPKTLRFNVFAVRAQLSNAAKRVAVAVENPDGSAERYIAVDLTLASATSLVVTSRSTAPTNHPIQGVYAR